MEAGTTYEISWPLVPILIHGLESSQSDLYLLLHWWRSERKEVKGKWKERRGKRWTSMWEEGTLRPVQRLFMLSSVWWCNLYNLSGFLFFFKFAYKEFTVEMNIGGKDGIFEYALWSILSSPNTEWKYPTCQRQRPMLMPWYGHYHNCRRERRQHLASQR